MKINRNVIGKINQRYDPDHDTGPTAPIHWSVAELTDLVQTLVDIVEMQQAQIEALQAAVPSAKRPQ